MAVVEVVGVKKDYVDRGAGTTHALRGVDLAVESGEFMAIAGPSGSGKTTLLNLIGGLDTPTAGSVKVDGRELATMTSAQLSDLRRDRIGFVFQAYNLIPVLSAEENAEYVMELKGVGSGARHERIEGLFERLGLAELRHKRPPKMSGGQQQRVAVARAIAAEPAVVLADEPTANLDQATGRALIEMMRELNRERKVTFIFSTHDPMVLEQADRVVRLVDGAVTSDDRKAGGAL
ncbi:MAG: ABC transporter ATP-binding protein [Deltaproteobacteria bacterium]|nr:ABC transporter ATP-binding protein [Deltaproteobacteria bacterium]